MICLNEPQEQPRGWELIGMGVGTACIVKRLQAGHITRDDALTEIVELTDRRGHSASEVGNE